MNKQEWTVANTNEVHDQPTRYDDSGARVGETAARICKVEYPVNDEEGQNSIACLMAAAPKLLAACEALMADMSTLIQLVQNGYGLDSFNSISCSKALTAIMAAKGK